MVEAYKKFWRNYTNFSGRSTVADYWWVVLCQVIIGFVLGFVGGLFGEGGVKLVMTLAGLYELACLIPALAICIRRLHDTNKSGWFLLIGLIPFVGGIILLVFMCMGSVTEGNNYGPLAE